MMILRSIKNLGLRIASALAGFFVWAWRSLFGEPLSLKEKAIAVGLLDSKCLPNFPTLIDETLYTLPAEIKNIKEEILNTDVLTIGEEVNKQIDKASKIHPCKVLSNVKNTYALGAAGGVATRAQKETQRDEAFTAKYKNSPGIEGWVSQVLSCRAKFAGLYNHIDDLKNTEGYIDLIIFNRLAIAVAYLIEVQEALKLAKEKYMPALNYTVKEAPITESHKKIKDNDYHTTAGAVAFFGQSSKKASKAEGIAEILHLVPPVRA
jgi:spore coat polysaccharide biosynthesis predicted glycosyltransferase SpsG